RRDQLERLGLPLELLADQVRDVGVGLVQRPKRHRGDVGSHRLDYPALGGGGPRSCAVGIAPSRKTCGSGPVRSSTDEAVPPGAMPPSTTPITPFSASASSALMAGS